jgi:zinc D-Ala-D-Ala carboxypeptidase
MSKLDTTLRLSPHFTLAELCASGTATARGLDNTPPPELLPRLIMLAEMLERIRSVVGQPIVVSSGYRCPQLNSLVGGATTSDHPQGHAADIIAPKFGTATELARLLAPLVSTLSIGQIILEGVRGKQWVHVSTREPERSVNRIITITDAGVMPGIIGLA